MNYVLPKHLGGNQNDPKRRIMNVNIIMSLEMSSDKSITR